MSAFTQPPKVLAIARLSAEYFGVTIDELLGRSQRHAAVKARQAAMYLSVRLSGRTVTDIGGILRRDRTTVHHNYRRLSRDVAFAPVLSALETAARDLSERASPAHVPPPKDFSNGTETQVATR